jgi:hypothetical protein
MVCPSNPYSGDSRCHGTAAEDTAPLNYTTGINYFDKKGKLGHEVYVNKASREFTAIPLQSGKWHFLNSFP